MIKRKRHPKSPRLLQKKHSPLPRRGGVAMATASEAARIRPHQKQEIIEDQASIEGRVDSKGRLDYHVSDPAERAALLQRGWERLKKEESAIVDQYGDVITGEEHDNLPFPEAQHEDDLEIPGYQEYLKHAMRYLTEEEDPVYEHRQMDQADFDALRKIKHDYYTASKYEHGSEGDGHQRTLARGRRGGSTQYEPTFDIRSIYPDMGDEMDAREKKRTGYADDPGLSAAWDEHRRVNKERIDALIRKYRPTAAGGTKRGFDGRRILRL